MTQRYRVLGRAFDAESSQEFQDRLGEAHSRKQKAYCLCRKGEELPLYIARRYDEWGLARWPGSGAEHATSCDHFDAPDTLTGLGQVRGSAVVDD